MIIRIVSQFFEPEIGAPQVRLAATARELAHAGHEVLVVTALPNYPQGRIQAGYNKWLYRRERLEFGQITRCPLFPSKSHRLFWRLLSYLSFCLSVVPPLLTGKRADFVFVESPPLFLAAVAQAICQLRGEKVVLNISDLWPDSIVELGMASRASIAVQVLYNVERWLYRRARYVCAVTKGIAKTLVDKGIPPEKILYLPNGADTERFFPKRDDEYSRKDGSALTILYAGLHGIAQGLQTLVEAAGILRDEKRVHFVFLGDGPEKEGIIAYAQSHSLDNVEFREPVPIFKMPNLLNSVDIFVVLLRNIPLFDGARPSKLFPAMAAGLPIIYSGHGEGARLVEKAQAGKVVQPEDPHALANAILELLEQRDLILYYGKNARRLVEEEYSWRTIIKEWLADLTHREQARRTC